MPSLQHDSNREPKAIDLQVIAVDWQIVVGLVIGFLPGLLIGGIVYLVAKRRFELLLVIWFDNPENRFISNTCRNIINWCNK